MTKQTLSTFGIIILLGTLPCFQVSANSDPNFKAPDLFPGLSYYEDSFMFSQSTMMSAKRGEQYDESKDPALRKGTENWEQPQGSFFVIPAVVVGLIFLILLFNRE